MNRDYQIKKLNIENIVLDKTNPRIAKYLEMYGDKLTAEQISLALGVGDSQIDSNGTTFQSLKASIRTNGGIIHPIIVNKTPSGKYIVIEGNTRVAIYKEFKESKVKGNWNTIAAIVYESMTPEEIDAIRLQTHLVGPRPWDPYSKAKYLEYLRNSEHLTLNQIVDYCGGRKKEVIDYIAAYETMEKYYRPQLESDDEFDPTRFSAFVELQNPKIKQAILDTNFTLKDFANWIIEFKIHPLNTVRQLHNILRNKKAKEIFLKHGRGAAKKAIQSLESPTPDAAIKDASLTQLAQEIINRILKLPYKELLRLKEEKDSFEVQQLIEAKDNLIDLCKEFESRD